LSKFIITAKYRIFLPVLCIKSNETVFFIKKLLSMKVKEQGLYLPEFEHDNCGAGFICNLNGIKSNDIIHKALDILIRTSWRREF
jgi:glutamate synthase (ferredoxin)